MPENFEEEVELTIDEKIELLNMRVEKLESTLSKCKCNWKY
tara:strand:+ start:1825 stop:1947 length:123 start_codon:yes stop_codon:yes gene_type:complete